MTKQFCEVDLHGRGPKRIATHLVNMPSAGWRRSCQKCMLILREDARRDRETIEVRVMPRPVGP